MAGKLLGDFGSPDAIFNASLATLEGRGLSTAVARAIHTRQPVSDAAKELDSGATRDEPEYPSRVREIYDPPPLLYVLGNIEVLSRHLIAIVGRDARPLTGIKWLSGSAETWPPGAWPWSAAWSAESMLVLHRGALSANGPTVGILGCGIDVVYPKENKKIFEEIQQRGANSRSEGSPRPRISRFATGS